MLNVKAPVSTELVVNVNETIWRHVKHLSKVAPP
jgi:hypothetical protein